MTSTYSVVLSGKGYNPRTKGELKKFLETNKVEHTMLGNGSFTGAIIEVDTNQLTDLNTKYFQKEGIRIEKDL